MANLFWLSDEQWAVLEPFMPQNQPGARRVDDRRVISGIVHVLKTGDPVTSNVCSPPEADLAGRRLINTRTR